MNGFETKTKLAPGMAMDRIIRRTVGLFKFLSHVSILHRTVL